MLGTAASQVVELAELAKFVKQVAGFEDLQQAGSLGGFEVNDEISGSAAIAPRVSQSPFMGSPIQDV